LERGHHLVRIVVRTSTAAQNRNLPGQHDLRGKKEFLGKKNGTAFKYIYIYMNINGTIFIMDTIDAMG